MKQGQSLQQIMNQMVSRLEQIVPDDVYADRAHDFEWPMIQVYIRIDPLLADLFKQYQDARTQYKKIERERGENDPLADVTRDMADSARAAVTTRYIELDGDEEFQGTAATEAQKIKLLDSYSIENDAVRRKQKDNNIYSGLAFMIWAAMIVEQRREAQKSLREAFSQTMRLAKAA